MGTFLDAVRAGGVTQPTQKGFSRDDWTQSFRATRETDIADRDLFEAGLYFDDVLTGIRDFLAQGDFRSLDRYDRLVGLCAFMNHEICVLEKLERDRGHALSDKSSQIDSISEVQHLIDLPSGIRVTPDNLITTIFDCVVYPLDDTLTADPGGIHLCDENKEELLRACILANAYGLSSDSWLDCLWNNKKIERQSDTFVHIVPRNINLSRENAVSDHRYATNLFSLASQAVIDWRHDLTLIEKRNFTLAREVTDFDARRKGCPYIVKTTRNHRKHNLPPGAVNSILAHGSYLKPFFEIPLPNYPRLTLDTVFRAWQVLGSLARVVTNRISREPGGWDWFMAHSIKLSREHIRAVFRKSLQIDENSISDLVQFLTYQPRTDGLWQKPLIALSDKELLVAIGPILYGDTLRIMERWLRQGGLDLGLRGPVFEQFARDKIAELMRNSRLLQDGNVAPTSVNVGPKHEEIDLLIRIGRLILVGEAKCQLRPVDPIEHYRFRERLKDGAEQARRKADAVRLYPEDIYDSLEVLPGTELIVVPFVLSNCVVESGYPVDGIAVVDLLYFGSLIKDGGLRTMVVLSRDGLQDPGEFQSYYYDQADAERRIPDLLLHQPVVEIFEQWLQRRLRPFPIEHADNKAAEVYYCVSTDPNPLDFERPEA